MNVLYGAVTHSFTLLQFICILLSGKAVFLYSMGKLQVILGQIKTNACEERSFLWSFAVIFIFGPCIIYLFRTTPII